MDLTNRFRRAALPRWSWWLAGLALITGWVWLLLPSGLGGPLSLVWVRGDSMQPTYFGGDLAVTYRFADYGPGDIVAFNIPEGGVVIHRIVDELPGGILIPQGDNRALADPWELSNADVIGRAMIRIPAGGRILAVIRQPLMLGLLAFATVLAVGLPDLWRKENSAPTGAADDDGDPGDLLGTDETREFDALAIAASVVDGRDGSQRRALLVGQPDSDGRGPASGGDPVDDDGIDKPRVVGDGVRHVNGAVARARRRRGRRTHSGRDKRAEPDGGEDPESD